MTSLVAYLGHEHVDNVHGYAFMGIDASPMSEVIKLTESPLTKHKRMRSSLVVCHIAVSWEVSFTWGHRQYYDAVLDRGKVQGDPAVAPEKPWMHAKGGKGVKG